MLLERLDLFRPGAAPDGLSDNERQVFRTCYVLFLLLCGMGVVSLVAQHYGIGKTPYQFRLNSVGFDLITNSGFLGIGLMYARLRTGLAEQVAIAVLGVGLEAFLWSQHPPSWGVWGNMMTIGIGLGLAGAVGICANLWAADPARRLRARGYLMVALFMMLFPTVTLWAHFVVMEWNPQVYDLYAFQLDGLPGFQPSFAVGRLLTDSPVLLGLALLIYNELPLLLVLAIFQVIDHPERAYNNVIGSFACMGLAGFLLYNLYPAVGLGILCDSTFPQGPTPEFPGEPRLLELWGPRNCMPSLHMSWILCLFFGVFRISRPVLAAALVSVGFTVLSTLYLGHYLIDLVAAFPLALVFQERTTRATVHNGPARRAALVGGLALLALVYYALRIGHATVVAFPPLALGGQAFIVVASLILERNLARATLAPAEDHVPSTWAAAV